MLCQHHHTPAPARQLGSEETDACMQAKEARLFPGHCTASATNATSVSNERQARFQLAIMMEQLARTHNQLVIHQKLHLPPPCSALHHGMHVTKSNRCMQLYADTTVCTSIEPYSLTSRTKCCNVSYPTHACLVGSPSNRLRQLEWSASIETSGLLDLNLCSSCLLARASLPPAICCWCSASLCLLCLLPRLRKL